MLAFFALGSKAAAPAPFDPAQALALVKQRFGGNDAKKAALIKAVDANGNVTHAYGTFWGKLVDANTLVWTNKSKASDVQTWKAVA